MPDLAELLEDVKIQDFDIDPERGFLPSYEPRSPYGGYPRSLHAQEGLALPKILASGCAREIIPEMCAKNDLAAKVAERILKNDRQALDEEMRFWSFLLSAYVYAPGYDKPADTVPKEIWTPLVRCAKLLGRPPILSYYSYAATNWFRLDARRPIELGNIAVCQNFLGGIDEDWFILVHVDIEAKMGPVPRFCFEELKSRAYGHLNIGPRLYLNKIAQRQRMANETMRKMPEFCDPRTYYCRVRPYIHGWGIHGSPIPEGIIFKGDEESEERRRSEYGETGAQSSIIPTLYAYLGIIFEEDEYLYYLENMRSYMPIGHRNFILFLEKVNRENGTLRDFIINSDSGWKNEWKNAYNECIDLLLEFLGSLHLVYARKYIAEQAERPHNPTQIGTGGSKFMEYLAKHAETVKAHKIP